MVAQEYHFKLGAFDCWSLSDGSMDYPLHVFFRDVPQAEVEEALRRRDLPTEQVTTPFACLLVDTGAHRLLVDTGLGRYAPSAGTLRRHMEAAGLDPAAVDTVVLTHGHADHVGGLVDERGCLSYPNARTVMARAEWEFWFSDAPQGAVPEPHPRVAREQLAALRDRVTLIEGETELAPGIRTRAAYGHTPGHTLLEIESEGERLLHGSDIALHVLHLEYPGWQPVMDLEPPQALVTKRTILDQAADKRLLVFAHHLGPFPNLGHVVRQGAGWSWQPVTPNGG